MRELQAVIQCFQVSQVQVVVEAAEILENFLAHLVVLVAVLVMVDKTAQTFKAVREQAGKEMLAEILVLRVIQRNLQQVQVEAVLEEEAAPFPTQ
jgi:hypothetical protein